MPKKTTPTPEEGTFLDVIKRMEERDPKLRGKRGISDSQKPQRPTWIERSQPPEKD